MISDSEESDISGPDSPQASSGQGPLRFECPVNFSRVTTRTGKQGGQDLLTSDCLHTADQELWVIRAPKDFDPKCLSGQKVKLHKGATVETEAGSRYDLQMTKNTQHLQQDGLTLLLPSELDGRLESVPHMHGEINILQSVAVPSVTIPPPAPPLNTQLPQGLRPRFKPFGWREPKPVNGHVSTQRRASGHSDKKKRKKRKHDIEDVEEVDSSKKKKTEEVYSETKTDRLVGSTGDTSTSTELEERSHKKKKKKKEKCKEEVEANVAEDISETPDSKKKKKKKDKHRESWDNEQTMVAEEAEETKVHKKKKKKKKKRGEEA
ncbi:DNA-directed RNA polymerase I subunit RPA34-like [Branchiostoma floridae x Branchiostoma japonicum]